MLLKYIFCPIRCHHTLPVVSLCVRMSLLVNILHKLGILPQASIISQMLEHRSRHLLSPWDRKCDRESQFHYMQSYGQKPASRSGRKFTSCSLLATSRIEKVQPAEDCVCSTLWCLVLSCVIIREFETLAIGCSRKFMTQKPEVIALNPSECRCSLQTCVQSPWEELEETFTFPANIRFIPNLSLASRSFCHTCWLLH